MPVDAERIPAESAFLCFRTKKEQGACGNRITTYPASENKIEKCEK